MDISHKQFRLVGDSHRNKDPTSLARAQDCLRQIRINSRRFLRRLHAWAVRDNFMALLMYGDRLRGL